jgi:putative hydrolase of the HAD superfamily
MLLKNRPQMIIFDAVGTLIHPRPAVAEVYERIGRRHGSKLRVPEIGMRFRRAFQEQDEIDRRAGCRTDEAREKARWRAIVESVLRDVPEMEPCFRELFDHFAEPTAWECGSDAGPVLESLARQGYRLGIASNYDRRLRAVVAGLSDLKPVQEIFVSSEIGWRKPSIRFFQALVTQAQLLPDQILHIGDDYANDVAAASSAGLQAWLLSPAGPPSSGNVSSLKAILSRLCLPSGRQVLGGAPAANDKMHVDIPTEPGQ